MLNLPVWFPDQHIQLPVWFPDQHIQFTCLISWPACSILPVWLPNRQLISLNRLCSSQIWKKKIFRMRAEKIWKGWENQWSTSCSCCCNSHCVHHTYNKDGLVQKPVWFNGQFCSSLRATSCVITLRYHIPKLSHAVTHWAIPSSHWANPSRNWATPSYPQPSHHHTEPIHP